MITQQNLKWVMNNLSRDEVEKALESEGDYVIVELHVFNTGGVVSIESVDYNEEIENRVAAMGNLFCDKDDFLRLASEVDVEF